MRISINESYFKLRPEGTNRTQLEALRLVRDGGFDTVDFSMMTMKRRSDEGDDHALWIRQRRDYCDSLGLVINQTHAPFFEGRPMPEGYTERLLQCVEDSAVLGADCLVVHADTWYEPEYIQWDYNKVLNAVYEVFAPVVELAEKLGVKIAMETLHEWMGNLYHRTRLCTFVEELDDIIGKFQSDAVGVCWDFGHAALVYKEDQFQAMKRLKSRIIATHVHDNSFKYDNHNLPYQGSIRWDEGLKTLAELGYDGDLTMELGYGALPDSLVSEFIRYAHKVGEHMVNQFYGYRDEILSKPVLVMD